MKELPDYEHGCFISPSAYYTRIGNVIDIVGINILNNATVIFLRFSKKDMDNYFDEILYQLYCQYFIKE